MADYIFETTSTGLLTSLKLNDQSIAFRNDEFAGPALYTERNGEQKILKFEQKGDHFESMDGGLNFTLRYTSDEFFHIKLDLTYNSDRDSRFDKLALRMGIDTYMESFPQWNDTLFPTMLRCEKDAFWGYLMSPNGQIVAMGCDSAIRSWQLDYNKVNKDNYGHRIYTFELDLFNKHPQPKRHTDDYDICYAGELYSWDIKLGLCGSIEEVAPTCAKMARIPLVRMENYTLEKGQEVKGEFFGDLPAKLTVVSPKGTKSTVDVAEKDFSFKLGDEVGMYTVDVASKRKVSQANLFVRHPWSWYLQKARENAISKPQIASTHLEGWYGFFSILLGAKHFPNEELDVKAKEHFDKILSIMYDLETATPQIESERACNQSVAISLLVDAYEAYGQRSYLDMAIKLGDWMIKHQIADGSYRAYLFADAFDEEPSGNGIHYTSVVYLLKSMLELVILEEKLVASGEIEKEIYDRHLKSVIAAANDLLLHLDNIDTEGELTFEDGMISCSALQLSMFALYMKDKMDDVSSYVEGAKTLLKKHRCLEQMVIPDCRRSGASLRFWEAQYDILLDKNMLNSPHGWTSWKNYATYYLYLATGEIEYLTQTMNTIGACMQMIDSETGNLRWAFVCDPCIETGVWTKADAPEYGKRVTKFIGEQYMDMISDWWTTIDDNPVGAYLKMPLRINGNKVESKNIGGSCDNDVHEHFKCMEEAVLTHSFVAQKEDGSLISYNCTVEEENGSLFVFPNEEIVTAIHLNLKGEKDVVIATKNGQVKVTVNKMEWVEL